MTYTYLVEFLITGNDHTGPCSKVSFRDADVFEYRVGRKTIKRDKLVKSLSDFNFSHKKCTSNKAWYCYGFEQRWHALRVLRVINNQDGASYSIDDKDLESDEESDEEESGLNCFKGK